MTMAQIILPITVGPLTVLLTLLAVKIVAILLESRAKRRIVAITVARIRQAHCGPEIHSPSGRPKHLPRSNVASRSLLAVRIRFRRIKSMAAKRRAARALVARLGRDNRPSASAPARPRPSEPPAVPADRPDGDIGGQAAAGEQAGGVVVPFVCRRQSRTLAREPVEDSRRIASE